MPYYLFVSLFTVHILLQRKQHNGHISHIYYGTISKYVKFLSDEFCMLLKSSTVSLSTSRWRDILRNLHARCSAVWNGLFSLRLRLSLSCQVLAGPHVPRDRLHSNAPFSANILNHEQLSPSRCTATWDSYSGRVGGKHLHIISHYFD